MWPDVDDPVARVNTTERGGDELMTRGLFLDERARDSALRGDYQAWIFELREVTA